MGDLSDPVPVSSISNLNKDLDSAHEPTMIELLGAPRGPLTTHCKHDGASSTVTRLTETRRMTEHFRLTGIRPALDSVQEVLADVKAEHPDLIDRLTTDGMLCVRHRKPTSGRPSIRISNHSWGTAIDFKLIGQHAPGDTGSVVPRWVAILVPFFNKAGWYSGISFNDAMHFEVAEQTIRKWKAAGLLGTVEPDDRVVVSSSGNILKPVSDFFSRLFGRG